ncbi:MAG TPA: carboxypeptidase regulatory-like domain-containing protein [Candidatus Acidoferrales bacterium]|nr:carboxypeptidase regulatory-like domain-containing protein [Candidatus Acidoferrales bacterium]
MKAFANIRAAILASAIASVGFTTVGVSRAQAPERGTISGMITADQGQVRGFRVKAHNVDRMIWYTVFTKDGHYTVPPALVGRYEMSVLQDGYNSQTKTVELGTGQSLTVDLATNRNPDPKTDVVYKTFDQMYPPGPGLDLLKKNCLGCHGPDSYNQMHLTEAGYRAGIERMRFGPFHLSGTIPAIPNTPMSAKEEDTIVKYLATNFGPDSPNQRLKHDPYPVDENALAKAIYVEYELPPDFPKPPPSGANPDEEQLQGQQETNSSLADIVPGMIGAAPRNSGTGAALMPTAAGAPAENANPMRNPWLHDPFLAKDDSVWYGAPQTNALVHLDPRNLDPEKRWQVFRLPTSAPPYAFIHGITLDSTGRVYWAEIRGGKLGEYDPETGKFVRYALPTYGSELQVVADEHDNIWYDQVHGSALGKLDARTRRISQWPTPTPDSGLYGLAVDPKGNIWSAGYIKSVVEKFDPATETFTEYHTLTPGSSARRIGVDSKGIVWFSEWSAGQLGSINPATGKMTEYKFPIRSTPYETWPDKKDNIWASDDFNNSLIYFNRQTNHFTYYPLPQNWNELGVPKVEMDKDNTVWIGSRRAEHAVAVHFYPNGYTSEPQPEP